MIRILGLVFCVAMLESMPIGAAANLPPLIPRKVLFSGWDRAALQLSPDGTRLAWLAAADSLPPNIWVARVGRSDGAMVTHDMKRGIGDYQWAADGAHLLYIQDANGDENWHLWSVDLSTGKVRDLTPFPGVRAQDLLVSERKPDEVLVGLNRRDPRVSDMYRIRLDTGEVTLEAENPGDVISWTADDNFVLRACTAFGGDDAHTTVRVRDDANSKWRDLLVIPFGDCSFYGQVNGGTLVAGFAPGGRSLYVVNPLGADRTRLVEIDAATGREVREIASDPKSDVEYRAGARLMQPLVMTDPANGTVQAVGFNYARLEWKVVDPAVQADLVSLRRIHAGNIEVVSRGRSDSIWLVHYDAPDTPEAWYLYRRADRSSSRIDMPQPELVKYRLAPMDTVVVRSRDGYDLLCYLTLPPGIPGRNLPLVLLPHGGPWWRDRWQFDPWVQLLANRGYAVIQPQYRGSTGFGKAFLNASNRQFGDQAIMGDYLDVVKWAVDSGLADSNRLAVMGGSGGGYAALCCVAFHPEMWKCAVDVVGPSSVKTLLHDIPEYWKPVKKRWVLRFGDAENDSALNQAISPLYHADRIKAPVLMAYGINDPRVHITEAEQMVTAMRQRQLPVTLVVYPDEGHMFARLENNVDLFGRIEEFVAEYLGGRKEPWQPVPGSSAEVRSTHAGCPPAETTGLVSAV